MSDLLTFCLVCLKIGAVVFGGGLVMLPMLEADVVKLHGWLTHDQFLDAIALGQMTPGPLLVTVTFIGYKIGIENGGVLGGVAAAAVATVCIFLPGFTMTLIAARNIGKLRGNRWVQGFMNGVKPTVVGLIAAAAVSIGQKALLAPGALKGGAFVVDPYAVALCLVALLLLIRFKVEGPLVILGAGLLGLVIYRLSAPFLLPSFFRLLCRAIPPGPEGRML